MGGAKDLVGPAHTAAHGGCCTKLGSSTATKVNETVRSHATNATAVATDACSKLRDSTVATATKVKETVKSRTAVATEYLSDPKSRDNLSKFAVNASINAAKFIPGGVGTAVDIVSQSIPETKKQDDDDDDDYIKRIEALENEVKELRQEKELKKHSATSKIWMLSQYHSDVHALSPPTPSIANCQWLLQSKCYTSIINHCADNAIKSIQICPWMSLKMWKVDAAFDILY